MPIKRKNSKTQLLFLVLFALLLAGCRSTKKVSVAPESGKLLPLLQQMQALRPIEGALSSKLKIEAELGEKKLSVGGTIGIERGRGLHMAATALGLFEVARLEATPVNFCVINKVGKEYTLSDYSPASLLGQVGLKYAMLQAVLLNEPFMPDGSDFASSLHKMTILREDNYIVAITPEYKKMQYTFRFDAATGELKSVSGVYNNKVRVICDYSDFEKLDKRTFPGKISIEIQGITTPAKLNLRLSSLKEGRYTFKKSNLSSYKKKGIKEIIKALE